MLYGTLASFWDSESLSASLEQLEIEYHSVAKMGNKFMLIYCDRSFYAVEFHHHYGSYLTLTRSHTYKMHYPHNVQYSLEENLIGNVMQSPWNQLIKLCQHHWIVSTVTAGMWSFCIVVMWQTHVLLLWKQQCPLSSHYVKDALCGSFSYSHMKCQLKPIPVSVTDLVMRSVVAMATKILKCLCCYFYISDCIHYSLRNNQLTSTGAIALARALQHNKSLKELKWVVSWVSLLAKKIEDRMKCMKIIVDDLLRLGRHTVM